MELNQKFKRWVTYLAFAYLLIVPTALAWRKLPTEAGVVLAVGGVVLFLLHLDRFESFTAGGLSAKMKQAEKTIEEGQATIRQLKNVVNYFGSFAVNNLKYNGLPIGHFDDPQIETDIDTLAALRNDLSLMVEEYNLAKTHSLDIDDLDKIIFNGIEQRLVHRVLRIFSHSLYTQPSEISENSPIRKLNNIIQEVPVADTHQFRERLLALSKEEGFFDLIDRDEWQEGLVRLNKYEQIVKRYEKKTGQKILIS